MRGSRSSLSYSIVLLELGALTGALASPADAEVVTSDDILRIRFTIDRDFVPFPPDTMYLGFTEIVDVIAPMTARVGELYDGDTLLAVAAPTSFGNHVGLLALAVTNSWAAPGSLYDFDDAATDVDFTTILDGTIDGRIDWYPETGAVDVPTEAVALTLLKATGAASGSSRCFARPCGLPPPWS